MQLEAAADHVPCVCQEGVEADVSSDEAESDGDEAAAAEALAVGSSDSEESVAAEALAEGSADDEHQDEAGGSEAGPGAADRTAQDGAAGLAVATTGTWSEEPEGRPARGPRQAACRALGASWRRPSRHSSSRRMARLLRTLLPCPWRWDEY